MADQRADTPRTAAGRALYRTLASAIESEREIVGPARKYPPADATLRAILAIEAEAAAESAAAEPTRWHHCDEECVGERAAQPPRGSLPDHRHEWVHVGGGPTHCWVCKTPRGSLPDDSDPIADRMLLNSRLTMALDEAGGSLTATEPPATFTDTWRQAYWAHRDMPGRHGGECCQDECWPDIGQRVIDAIAPSILQEIDSGSPGGVTPALDEDLVARIFHGDIGTRLYFYGAAYGHSPDESYEKIAADFAAEYARLGSPEDSDAVDR